MVPSAGLLFYDEASTARTLRSVALTGTPDLLQGQVRSPTDWYTRSRWDLAYHEASQSLYYLGDERNDEVLNLWKLSLSDGALTRLTDEPYVYGWSFNADETRIAVLGRRPLGDSESEFTTCLDTMNPDGTDRTRIVCDSPAVQFTWSEPAWTADGRGLVTAVNLAGRRDRTNLAWISFATSEIHVVTEPKADRSDAVALHPWLSRDEVAYWSDETGFDQLYVYNVTSGKRRQLSKFDREISWAKVLNPDQPRIAAVLHRPDEDRIVVLDPKTGAELGGVTIAGTATVIGDDKRGQLWVSITSGSSPFRVDHLTIGEDGSLTSEPWLQLPTAVADQLVRCTQERVSIPTWDIDPATKKPRELSAFLYRPVVPVPAQRALVRVQSFYGGENAWSTETQVFCDAGISTLSASVRGSDGYGLAFSSINDGDLGGDEIVDDFALGKWLETQGFSHGHVGIFGRSHGGYATVRALTFPPGTNGHTDDLYAFGFGMADAGFYDIASFYAASNIPDWVELEAGNPATEAEKLHDRSPLSHVDLLAAPLFLSHGENDNRVPVAESRAFAAACAAAGKGCTYVEFAGQGHRVRGLENEVRLYQARFDFLNKVLTEPATP